MAQLSIQQAFDLALQLHRAGQLQEADALYQQIPAGHPRHVDALHHRGVIAATAQQYDIAIQFLRQTIALQPLDARNHYSLGNVLREMGQLQEAIAEFQQAVFLNPQFFEAQNNLGHVLMTTGQFAQAANAFRQATALNPGHADAFSNLGNALCTTGQPQQAIDAYRRAIALNPNSAQTYSNLGNALHQIGQLDKAIAAHRKAIDLQPAWAGGYYNLSNALRDIGQLDDAIAIMNRSIFYDPKSHRSYNNLGAMLNANGEMNHAIAAYRTAILLKPDDADAHYNLGMSLQKLGEYDQAIAAYQQAIALAPEFADAHHDLALALLRRGDLEQGWRENQWRWKIKNTPAPREMSVPQWNGEDLHSKSILLHAERGFGDSIHFIRYASVLARGGARVIFEAPAELMRLAQRATGVHQVIQHGHPIPPVHFHCPLLTLPLILKTTLQTIPVEVPYLSPDPEQVENWRQKLPFASPTQKVGIVWAGNPQFSGDATRSLSLNHLAPLAAIQGVTFYSLQKGLPAEQADHPPAGLQLINLSPQITDFSDTAAVMSLMDLIITTDTSVPHLAGAIGRPVWLMLQFVADWRWFTDRSDSPWYPTMRLFRQETPGDWGGVILRVVEELRSTSAGRPFPETR